MKKPHLMIPTRTFVVYRLRVAHGPNLHGTAVPGALVAWPVNPQKAKARATGLPTNVQAQIIPGASHGLITEQPNAINSPALSFPG